MEDWTQNLVEDERAVLEVLRHARRIAVLGIRSERDAVKPAYAVPHYLQAQGYEVLPVPVKGAGGAPILGQPTSARVVDVPGEVDGVEVFRKPEDIPAHLEDLLAKRPQVVWFQLGIRHEAAAERLARAGIRVVQDRCMKLERMKLPPA